MKTFLAGITQGLAFAAAVPFALAAGLCAHVLWWLLADRRRHPTPLRWAHHITSRSIREHEGTEP